MPGHRKNTPAATARNKLAVARAHDVWRSLTQSDIEELASVLQERKLLREVRREHKQSLTKH